MSCAICLFDTFFIHPVEFNLGFEVWIFPSGIVSHCAIRKKREHLKISAKVYLLFTVIVLGKLFEENPFRIQATKTVDELSYAIKAHFSPHCASG